MGKFKEFYESTLKNILFILLTIVMDFFVIYSAFFVVNFPATLLILFITLPILVPFNYCVFLILKELFKKKKDEQD